MCSNPSITHFKSAHASAISTLSRLPNATTNSLNPSTAFAKVDSTTFLSISQIFYGTIAKYTYVSSNVVNNVLMDHPVYLDRFINSEKPVKFNVKVLVCCGLKDPENERVDHNYTKKLR